MTFLIQPTTFTQKNLKENTDEYLLRIDDNATLRRCFTYFTKICFFQIRKIVEIG